MKLHKFVLLVLVAMGSLFTSACSSDIAVAHQKTTCLGLFTYEPASFAVTDPSSMTITTDEIYGMEYPSGDRLQLLWGLVSFEDF